MLQLRLRAVASLLFVVLSGAAATGQVIPMHNQEELPSGMGGTEGRAIGFRANATFSIQSVGLYAELSGAIGSQVPQDFEVLVYSSTNGMAPGGVLATTSASVGGEGLKWYDIPLSFEFQQGSHYVLSWRIANGSTQWTAFGSMPGYRDCMNQACIDAYGLPGPGLPYQPACEVTLINGLSGFDAQSDNVFHARMRVGIATTDPQPTCGPSCNATSVACLLASSEAYANRSFVGLVSGPDPGGSGLTVLGTGWLVAGDGASGYLVTAAHLTTDTLLSGFRVQFGFECSDCGFGCLRPTTDYDIVEQVHRNPALDYAILRLDADPSPHFGLASIDPTEPALHELGYALHHASPGGIPQPKGFSHGLVTEVGPAAPAACVPSLSAAAKMSIVTTGGSSGAPIFRASNDCVMAVLSGGNGGGSCSSSICSVPMSAIFPELQAVLAGRGTAAQTCGASPGSDLVASVGELSLATGGAQALLIQPGASFAGLAYLLLGSASGSTPGVLFDGFTIPLNAPDFYLDYTLTHPGAAPIESGLGVIGATGSAAAAFELAPNSPLVLLGLELTHAYVLLNAQFDLVYASSAVELQIVP